MGPILRCLEGPQRSQPESTWAVRATGFPEPIPFGVNGCPDPSGCVEFTPGDYTGCSNGSIAPGTKGCLNLPFGGSRPRFNANGTNWQPSHSYTVGALVMPATPTCTSNPI